MKKKFLILPMLAAYLLLSSQSAFAMIAWRTAGDVDQEALRVDSYGCTESFDGNTITHDCRTIAGTSIVLTGNLTFKTSFVAAGSPAASTQVATSSTNLAPATLPFAIIYKNVSPGAGSRDGAGVGTQLPNGVPGQTLRLVVPFIGGSGQWVITPATSTGWTKAVFTTTGELRITYINDTIGWVVDSTIGTVTITYPQFAGN